MLLGQSVRDGDKGKSDFAKEILEMNPLCLSHHFLKVGTGVVRTVVTMLVSVHSG